LVRHWSLVTAPIAGLLKPDNQGCALNRACSAI
jgi:hypothetical protein